MHVPSELHFFFDLALDGRSVSKGRSVVFARSDRGSAGVGQAEGFKFAPLVSEYVAQRVLGNEGDPKLVKAFKLPTEQYEAPR